MKRNLLIAKIDAILPQTQCRQCGFDGCESYATAIAEGRALINQCPPGGEQGIHKLAELLGLSPIPLNTAHGITKPEAAAFIDEQTCIGCTLCIAACPVDAIVGAAKLAHAVISAECTGCELCIPACPVNCITMVPVSQVPFSAIPDPFVPRSLGSQTTDVALDESPTATRCFSGQQDQRMKASDRARTRYRSRLQRLEREKTEREEKLVMTTGITESGDNSTPGIAVVASGIKRAAIEAALARARASQSRTTGKNRA
jgi:electron transport complex protein RnfB